MMISFDNWRNLQVGRLVPVTIEAGVQRVENGDVVIIILFLWNVHLVSDALLIVLSNYMF